jgi:hypothetical protein
VFSPWLHLLYGTKKAGLHLSAALDGAETEHCVSKFSQEMRWKDTHNPGCILITLGFSGNRGMVELAELKLDLIERLVLCCRLTEAWRI